MAKGKTKRHASALKASRKAEIRKASNYQVRSKVRTLTANVLKAVRAKELEAAKVAFRTAQSAWQKAAKSKIFNRHTASRKIGHLAARIAALAKG
jgi:small subunit ribosomal protein S20